MKYLTKVLSKHSLTPKQIEEAKSTYHGLVGVFFSDYPYFFSDELDVLISIFSVAQILENSLEVKTNSVDRELNSTLVGTKACRPKNPEVDEIIIELFECSLLKLLEIKPSLRNDHTCELIESLELSIRTFKA